MDTRYTAGLSHHILKVKNLKHKQLLAIDARDESGILVSPLLQLLPCSDILRKTVSDGIVQDVRREWLWISSMYDARIGS
jgi:hypothetical protein